VSSMRSAAAARGESPPDVGESGVGPLLRHWRGVRSKSQLALALDANVSARHVSFIESGRSKPSRAMILTLAGALDVPLRERNAMLMAAGFASLYRESPLDAPALAHVRRALEFILVQQEPHPAVVMDRHWNILMANEGARRLFGRFIDLASIPQPANVLDLMFDPGGLRPFVANWDEVAVALLTRVRREAVCGVQDAALKSLVRRLLAYPDVHVRWNTTRLEATVPLIPVRFATADFSASYFSTVTTLGTAQDVTLQEIRIECFFPSDEATAAAVSTSPSADTGSTV